MLFSTTISLVTNSWREVHRYEQDLDRDPDLRVMGRGDRLPMVLQAAQTELRSRLAEADGEVKGILRQLNDMDKVSAPVEK